MKICETTLGFLEADCKRFFGEEAGTEIARQTETIYQDLLCGADDRGSEAIREHLRRKLLPPLAYYKALRARGLGKARLWNMCAGKRARRRKSSARRCKSWLGCRLRTACTAWA